MIFIKFLLGILMFFGVLFLFALINANWEIVGATAIFLDAPTALAFTIVLCAVIVATGQLEVFTTGVKAVFSSKVQLSCEKNRGAIRLFKLLRKTTQYAALLFVAMGLTQMLGNLQDIDALAANFALVLLAVIYAAVINLILINPAIAILERRESTTQTTMIKK